MADPEAVLERWYPKRCYDCMVVIPLDAVLCVRCERLYEQERQRRRG